MAKNRVISRLVCGQCKEKNYTQKVSKQRTIGALQLRKYCPRCRKCCLHKESK